MFIKKKNLTSIFSNAPHPTANEKANQNICCVKHQNLNPTKNVKIYPQTYFLFFHFSLNQMSNCKSQMNKEEGKRKKWEPLKKKDNENIQKMIWKKSEKEKKTKYKTDKAKKKKKRKLAERSPKNAQRFTCKSNLQATHFHLALR